MAAAVEREVSNSYFFSFFFDVLSNHIQAFVGAGESTQKKLNGIIADLLVDLTSVAASAPDGSDAASNLFDLVRTPCDVQTLACGDAYTSFSAARPNDRDTFPVEKRAAKVPKQHLSAARDLDQKFHNSLRGEVGPIEAKLLEFGARDGPKPHAVVRFVLGAFGELPNSCYRFCTAIARVDAARVVSFWKTPPKHALTLCKQNILRFWGLTAQRCRARLILDRFHDLLLSPGGSTAATHEPDSVSHEHRIYFFPDTWRGAASTVRFGWRLAAASKRPFQFSGSTCCVSTSFLLRGARKIRDAIALMPPPNPFINCISINKSPRIYPLGPIITSLHMGLY
jgi:hypothetical protein